MKIDGTVRLTNGLCYQDFIGILINNGYSVEVTPIEDGKYLEINIYRIVKKESEEK